MKKTSMLLGNTLSAYLVINQHLRTMYTFCSCQSLHTKIWAKNVLYFQVITMYIYRVNILYSKTCLKRPLKKKTNIGFQDNFSLNAGHKYCRMLQGEHSAILLTFIKLIFVIMIFVLSG